MSLATATATVPAPAVTPEALLPRRRLATPAADRLAALVDPLTARMRGPELEALAEELPLDPPAAGIEALVHALETARQDRARVDARAERLRARALEASPEARQALVVRHLRAVAEESGGSGRALRRDLGAAARGALDLACLLEREGAVAEALGVRLELCCRLAPGLVALREAAEGPDAVPASLDADQLQAALAAVAREEARRPTRLAATRALADLLSVHGEVPGLSPVGLRTLQRLARDPDEDPWVRRAALGVARGLPPQVARAWLEVARASEGEDGALIRARAVELWLERADLPVPEALAPALEDDSELVRFAAADGAARRLAQTRPDAPAARRQVEQAGDPRVRARLAWSLRQAGPPALEAVAEVLLAELRRPASAAVGIDPQAATDTPAHGPDPFVVRTALDAALECLRSETAPAGSGRRRLRDALAALPHPGPPALQRRAWLLTSWLDLGENPARAVAAQLAGLEEGEGVEIRLPADTTALHLARALVPHAGEGHGFQLDPEGAPDRPGATVRVVRGDPEAPAAWRVLDELRHPAPAKRQGHTHTSGRADRGPLRVPPLRTAEATPTGVPGQRVHLDREDGWAPEVPMADDLLHALSHSELVIVTPAGLTRVRPPASAAGRLRARLALTWRFRRIDRLRHDGLASEDPDLARAWAALLDRMGFSVEVQPADPARPPVATRAWIDPLAFAVTMGASTLSHLAALVLLLGGVLLGRLSQARWRLHRARRALPLVMGGWGTRGKSGTERLKSGLLEALGLPFVTKTTGCEAMLLHAPPGGRARELFLYRPYDKATIWEQAEVATLAPRLGARALLWECMALNPRYVDLLQQRWMRDDVSTLTNAFPDHEDIQGPTGRDVARIIGSFAPPGRVVLTAEEGMLPVLRTAAARNGAAVAPVRPAEAALLPRDLLARFRHAEHPANVALVARLAEGLGLPRTEAVGWMAERVVADVGALVIHPPAHTAGRAVIFAQGQSANDPLSFRHNWRTAGFTAPCPPGEIRVTVVNNRADRIPRSRMFAGLLADEAAAHRHVLIGTNLSGLRSYLMEEVAARLERTDLSQATQVRRLFAHLRLDEPGVLGAACASALGASTAAAEAWARAVAEVPPADAPTLAAGRRVAREARGPAELLASALPEAQRRHGPELVDALVEATARRRALDAGLASGTPADLARLYTELVEASLIVVDDPKASGDRIIDTAVRAAPPGATVRLMGLQNIKGTGLDFAYRWVEWGELSPRLADLAAAHERRDHARIHTLLGELGTRGYGSVMACDAVLHALAPLPDDPELRAARTQVEAARTALQRARETGGDDGGPVGALLDVVERFLDPFDAVWRRRRAAWILRELGAMRLSHDRAEAELKALVDRQKGGWLRGRAGK